MSWGGGGVVGRRGGVGRVDRVDGAGVEGRVQVGVGLGFCLGLRLGQDDRDDGGGDDLEESKRLGGELGSSILNPPALHL